MRRAAVTALKRKNTAQTSVHKSALPIPVEQVGVPRVFWNTFYVPAQEPYFSGVPNGFAPGFRAPNTANAPFNWDQGVLPGYSTGIEKTIRHSTCFRWSA